MSALAITWESAEQLLARYPTLGIPHFQRGLVWGTDSVALLLESLFCATPCGTVILRQPLDAGSQGISLGPSLLHLIVDGQQRIRSLHSVFGENDAVAELGERESNADEAPRVWCIDLSHFRSLAPCFGPPSRHSLFRLVIDPSDERARLRAGLVPITWFAGEQTSRIEDHLETFHPPQSVTALLRSDVIERVRGMRSNPLFAVRILEESADQSRLADVVAVYNRINSAGRRVEAEERAYASLVAYAPTARNWLGDLFVAIHPSSDRDGPAERRDDVLQRRKERSFGFKLFLRTFVQVAAYHTGYSIGRGAFSFDLLASDGFNRHLSDPKNAGRVDEMLSLTREILTFTRRVLESHLRCDDLRMLPETSSLWPALQLLTRFPAVMRAGCEADGASALAGLMLRSYLATRESRELLRLVEIVNGSQTASACVDVLARSLPFESVMDQVREGLRRALSLQDRFALILYWLLRKQNAKDLSYENLVRLDRKRLEPEELALSEAVEPEKQHLVPYSRLAIVYEMSGRDRIATHEANGIGNLTYISRRLNGFEEGLGSDPIDLASEPPTNRDAHFLSTIDGSDLPGAFSKALAAGKEDSKATKEDSKAAFRRFCETRRGLIEKGFETWLHDTDAWMRSLDSAGRIDPCERFFFVTEPERIRRMAYPAVITDELLRWHDARCLRRTNRESALGKREVFRLDAAHGTASLAIELLPDQITLEPLLEQVEACARTVLPPSAKIEQSSAGRPRWVLALCGREGDEIARVLRSAASSVTKE